jgi:hypothetical protein
VPFASREGQSLPFVTWPPLLREQERFGHHKRSVGVAMGLAAASSAFIFAQEAAASQGDESVEPAPQRPQYIVRKATKQVGMTGFLKPMTDAEKLAKEQRELANFKADCATPKVADAEQPTACSYYAKAPLPGE